MKKVRTKLNSTWLIIFPDNTMLLNVLRRHWIQTTVHRKTINTVYSILRLNICDSHLTCKVAHKCLNVRERVEVVEWNRKRFPPFPCCPVSCQCPWKKTLIEKKKKYLTISGDRVFPISFVDPSRSVAASVKYLVLFLITSKCFWN